MAEFLNPAPRFFDAQGKILAGGSITFLTTATTTKKKIFLDINLQNEAANPVILGGGGEMPFRFLDGSYRIQIKNAAGTLIDDIDPIGGNPALFGALGDWNAAVRYSIDDTVQGSNGNFYISLVNNNLAKDPTTPNPDDWTEIRFIDVYNASQTFSIGDVVQETGGLMWYSVVNSNLANTPSSDSGANWLPVVDGSKLAAVVALETRTTTVIPQTGTVTLTALRINELQDAGPFEFPLANSVAANQIIIMDFPSTFAAFEPVVNRGGSDTITNKDGTDTSITFKGTTRVIAVSDGISNWRI